MVRKGAYIVALAATVLSAAGTVLFAVKIGERNRYIDALIQDAVGDPRNVPTDELVLRLSDAIYRRTYRPMERGILDGYSRWESESPFNVTSAVALRYGGYGIHGHSVEGACGTMTRALLNALWRAGVPARKLQLLDNEEGRGGGHTLVEYKNGGRWQVIAPSDSSFVWRTRDGRIATAAEIQADYRMFSAIYAARPRYPYLFDNPRHIRWEKLPPRWRRLARFVLGRKHFEQAKTPRLYDLPRTLFLLVSLAGAVVSGTAALLLRPRRQERGRAAARISREMKSIS